VTLSHKPADVAQNRPSDDSIRVLAAAADRQVTTDRVQITVGRVRIG
jgi:hypothetical protein